MAITAAAIFSPTGTMITRRTSPPGRPMRSGQGGWTAQRDHARARTMRLVRPGNASNHASDPLMHRADCYMAESSAWYGSRSDLPRRSRTRGEGWSVAFAAVLIGGVAMGGDPEPETIAAGFHSIYSPYVYEGRLYAGGWWTPPERVPWPDLLFQARWRGDSWSDLEPLHWADGNLRGGEIEAHHANDPVVFDDHLATVW
jgi:hypothetical protein